MRLTKYTHACIRIDDDADRRLVIDPGVFSEVSQAVEGVDAVLITHEHPDHVDATALAAAAAVNPDLAIWAPQSVIDQLAKLEALAGRLTAVGPGQTFMAAGMPVRTFGGQHALIHSSIPVVSNVAYLVADAVYHPGDSFVVPTAGVEVLLLPLHAPWSKMSEVVDFAVSVRAPKAFQVHDSLLSEVGQNLVEGQVTRIVGEHGSVFKHLDAFESVDV